MHPHKLTRFLPITSDNRTVMPIVAPRLAALEALFAGLGAKSDLQRFLDVLGHVAVVEGARIAPWTSAPQVELGAEVLVLGADSEAPHGCIGGGGQRDVDALGEPVDRDEVFGGASSRGRCR